MAEESGYKPISDYGIIGNLRTAALVGLDGAIDWCCLPRMDSPSVFAALLDSRRGGRFRIHLKDDEKGEQEYVGNTNILRTRFRSGETVLTVTDFMPLSGGINGRGEATRSQAPPEIHRIVECAAGEAEVELEWSPRFDYARAATVIERRGDTWRASGGGNRMTLIGAGDGVVYDDGSGPRLRAVLPLRHGESISIVLRWNPGSEDESAPQSGMLLRRTMETWTAWAEREDLAGTQAWAGEFEPLVTRSALVLKLLTNADTGAMAAAPTTSLPEDIGGVRNWDYRFAWLRDSALTAQALASVGHEAEGADFLEWLMHASEEQREEEWDLRIMYPLQGGSDMEERCLDHLEGYRRSRPVRTGNAAARQFQLETCGEMLSIGYEIARREHRMTPDMLAFMRKVADHVCDVWRQPDSGIWEIRGRRRHYVYSKVMAWVALDRAQLLASRFGLEGDTERWRAESLAIREEVLARGYDPKTNSFVMDYDGDEADAALLRIPLVEFLPFDDPRVQGTIDRIVEQLVDSGFVYRYLTGDGLPGREGAFGLCTFWLIDALALSGRQREARDMLARMARHSNHLGLYPEQFDPGDGAFLGNFPQALTHIGLINSVIYLAFAEGRDAPEHAPAGSRAHRQQVRRE